MMQGRKATIRKDLHGDWRVMRVRDDKALTQFPGSLVDNPEGYPLMTAYVDMLSQEGYQPTKPLPDDAATGEHDIYFLKREQSEAERILAATTPAKTQERDLSAAPVELTYKLRL